MSSHTNPSDDGWAAVINWPQYRSLSRLLHLSVVVDVVDESTLYIFNSLIYNTAAVELLFGYYR